MVPGLGMTMTPEVAVAVDQAAAEDDIFAPEGLEGAIRGVFWAVMQAGCRHDTRALDALRDRGSSVRWPAFNAVPAGEPDVRLVTVHNESDDTRDRVVFCLRYEVRPTNEQRSECWELVRRADGWLVAAVKSPFDPLPQMQATPWQDARIGDDVTFELAADDAVEPADLRQLAGRFDHALDLALVDDRFAPRVIELAVRQVVEAWEASMDGDRSRLLALADPSAARVLLSPHPDARLVLYGPTIRGVTVVSIRLEAEAPTATVEVRLQARRWLAAARSGSVQRGRRRRSRFTEVWTFRLTGDAHRPWRLAQAQAPTW
jgi:hypothetical protein